MLWENPLAKWSADIRQHLDIPARLILWDGQRFDFGRFATPRLVLRVQDSAALPYLLQPSLDNLSEAYISGLIDFEGSLADIIETGYALSRFNQERSGGIARVVEYGPQTARSDKSAVQYHYDVSNAFYQLWLDPNLVYSCAYFEQGNEGLGQAQLKKIDHILTKIRVQPGQTLLDLGCGWGALVMRAAAKFGARCVGITLSQNQYDLAWQRVEEAGLADRVEIRLQDYREVEGRFDRITSVGMFEHVGRENLVTYFTKVHDLLADDGVALNHGITTTDLDDSFGVRDGSQFIDRYVFPKGEVAHIGQVLCAMQEGGLEALDIENLRRHYARTLSLWADNFERETAAVREQVSDEVFRIWRVYLAGCAYAFDHELVAIHQVLCQRTGRPASAIPWSRRYIYA